MASHSIKSSLDILSKSALLLSNVEPTLKIFFVQPQSLNFPFLFDNNMKILANDELKDYDLKESDILPKHE
jgi:hypothetical protein